MTGEILRTGLEFAANGICAVPVATDGSKRPALANWKLYQERLPTPDELLTWFANAEGVGVSLRTVDFSQIVPMFSLFAL